MNVGILSLFMSLFSVAYSLCSGWISHSYPRWLCFVLIWSVIGCSPSISFIHWFIHLTSMYWVSQGFPGGASDQEPACQCRSQEDPLEEGMATHSSILFFFCWQSKRFYWERAPGQRAGGSGNPGELLCRVARSLGFYGDGISLRVLQYSCLENPHGQRSLAGYSP